MESADIATSASQNIPSLIFVELTSLSEVTSLTTTSARIKFTCISASPAYLAVGSSSGGSVYLFSRCTNKRRKSLNNVPFRVIPCKEGEIWMVEISPDETKVAIANTLGLIWIVDISGNRSITIITNVLHAGNKITCLTWSRDSSRLYAGDLSGKVSLSRVGKTYFISPCDLILRLEEPIVQIDSCSSLLIVSTISRSYLHDFSRLTTIQIGKKLRNGNYGGCFFNDTSQNNDNSSSIFVSRPGARLWQANINGSVHNTHQFTTVEAPCSNVINEKSVHFFVNEKTRISFSKLNIISQRFLISINYNQIIVLDPNSASIVLLTTLAEEVLDYSISGNDLFVLTSNYSIRKLTLLPFIKAVEKLQAKNCSLQSAKLIEIYIKQTGTCPWKLDIIKCVLSNLQKIEDPFATEFSGILEKAKEICKFEQQNSTNNVAKIIKLPSGIHEISKLQTNSGYEDDFSSIFESRKKLSLLKNCQILYDKIENGPSVMKNGRKILSRDDVDELKSPKMHNGMASSRSEESLHKLVNNDFPAKNDQTNFSLTNQNYPLKSGKILLDGIISQINTLKSGEFVCKEKSDEILDEKIQKDTNLDGNDNEKIENLSNPIESDNDDVIFDQLPSIPNVYRHKKMVTNPKMTSSKREKLGNGSKMESAIDQKSIGKSAIDFNYCSNCSMHKSWLAFFRFCFVLKRLPLFEGNFFDGCLPNNVENWAILLNFWRSKRESSRDLKRCLEILCPECAILLQKWKSDFYEMAEKSFSDKNGPQNSTKSSPWDKITVEELEKIFLKKDNDQKSAEKVAQIEDMGKNDESNLNKIGSNLNSSTSCCLYFNPVYKSCLDNLPENFDLEILNSNFNWMCIEEISLDLLLLAAYKILNFDAFELLIVQNSWAGNHLSKNFYAALLSYKTKTAFLPDEIVNLLCYDLFGDKTKLLPYTDIKASNVHEKPTLKFDLSKPCSICQIPIRNRKSEVEASIIVRICGHVFHKSCLISKDAPCHSHETCQFCSVHL